MPIFKTANSKGKYCDLKAKEQVIGYIMNPAKTPHGFRGGSMVDPSNIAQSMNEVSEKYVKLTAFSADTSLYPSIKARSGAVKKQT